MTTARAQRTPALSRDDTSEATGSRRAGLLWAGGAMLLTVAIAASRLLVNPRFYFADDTERGSFGQWWQLGEYLSRGQLPVLDPSAWQAGNYFAEGQWGILSPITWLIGITAYGAESPVVHTTIVKIAFLAVFALGVHLLAREFGAARPWAALVAVLAPAAGFTVYMDAASWSTGLFTTALLPWVWFGLRRAVDRGRSPIAYLVASFSLVTIGYVFGVLVLILLLVESLARHGIARDRVRVVRTLAASVWGGLWTIVVYLPAVMTAPVTERGDQPFANFLFLNADLTDFASSSSPWVTATIHSWWGDTTAAPLMYIAWLLPLLVLFLPLDRELLRRCAPLLVVGGVMTLVVLGPSHFGALRWPIRMIPYVVIAILVLFAVAATAAFPARIRRRSIAVAVAVIAVTGYLSYANEVQAWKSIGLTVVLQLSALIVVTVLARRRFRVQAKTLTALVVVGALATTVGVSAVQLRFFPSTPLPSVGMPDDAEALTDVLADAHGDGIVVGNGEAGARIAESWDERLMANLWYLSPTPVSSLYTVLPYSTYTEDLCSDLRGVTCADALETLWSTDAETGLPVADLLSVSTIVAMKATYRELPPIADGWQLVDEGEYTWLLQRDEALPGAGGVTWTGDGTAVTVTEQSDAAITFTVDAVGSDPRVALSRLDYPGYSVNGAAFDEDLRGYLLSIDLEGVEPGDAVTVSFLPPPFPVLAASFVLAVLLAAGWLAARLVARRRAVSSA